MTVATPIAERTYLARLTPAGSGAIAVLALVGPDAGKLLAELFVPLGKPGKSFLPNDRQALTPGQFWLGRLADSGQGPGDTVVVALKSLTPQPSFEIHCHGGQQVIALIEEQFSARGAAICDWTPLLQVIGTDPITIAAQQALAEAATARAAAVLLDQYHGAFARAAWEIVEDLQRSVAQPAVQRLEELTRWSGLGRHLTVPWSVAVAGAPNVGKSSLINRLAGYQRCVVAPTPGTTRDLVSTRIAVEGWPVELIDTAGIRAQAGALEAQGIALAQAAVTDADLCLWVLDAAAPPVLPPVSIPQARLVINKTDLSPAWNLDDHRDALRVSAITGTGLDELVQAISGWLVPEAPEAGAPVPFTPELSDAVAEALRLCREQRFQDAAAELSGWLTGK